MVLMPEPVFRSVEAVPDLPRPLYLLSPGGRRFDQSVAAELAARRAASRSCAGATRGWTSGWRTTWSTASCRSGTTCWPAGSWPPSSSSRRWPACVPGVLGNEDSALDESFSGGLLEYPQYTRPAEFRGWAGARGPALGRPRRRGRLAAHPGPAPDGGAPARPARAPGQGRRARTRRRACPGRARLRCPVRPWAIGAPSDRAGMIEGRLSCTPPKRSTATACATTSPSSGPATPSRSTSAWSRATGSGSRCSREP